MRPHLLLDLDADDEVGMRASSFAVNELITAEVDAGTPAEKIVLGGTHYVMHPKAYSHLRL